MVLFIHAPPRRWFLKMDVYEVFLRPSSLPKLDLQPRLISSLPSISFANHHILYFLELAYFYPVWIVSNAH